MYKFTFIIYFLVFFTSFFCNLNLENFNKRIYSFNRGIDSVLIKPCLNLYISILPSILKIKFNNLFTGVELIQTVFLTFFSNKLNLSFSFYTFNSLSNSFFSLLNFNISRINLINLNDFFFTFLGFKYIFLPFLGPIIFNNFMFFSFIQFFNIFLYKDCFFYYFFYLINKRVYLNYDLNFFHLSILDGYSFLKDIFLQVRIFNQRV